MDILNCNNNLKLHFSIVFCLLLNVVMCNWNIYLFLFNELRYDTILIPHWLKFLPGSGTFLVIDNKYLSQSLTRYSGYFFALCESNEKMDDSCSYVMLKEIGQ